MDYFYSACAAAGPAKCALAEPTASGVQARLDALFARLRHTPVAVLDHGRSDYGIVDYSLVRTVVFLWASVPFQKAPWNASDLAAALAALERGDGHPIREISRHVLYDLQPTLECNCGGAPAPAPKAWAEANTAIACGDGEEVTDGLEELQRHYERMAQDSSFAEIWSARVKCA
jgi:hypothetical protein